MIDEQHRFGVVQRGTLAAKGSNPDVLVMTATPIPRTLALTECGDMEVSVIRGLPPGRQPIKTIVKADSRRDEVYAMMREEVRRGRQVYVIYPLVEESEKIDLKAATAMSEQIAQVFPEFAVALLHGRMKGDEKEAVMHRFAAGQLHILVSTTVVEVGVDVAERHADGDRACRAIRLVAAAPAARAHRPRRSTPRRACCCIRRRGLTMRASGSRRWPTRATGS